MQNQQQDTQNIEECYVASQVYMHDECYNLDTNISLQALQMVKNNQSFLEIRDENLIKLNESITKKKLELYIRKQQQQQQNQNTNPNFSLTRIEQFLQSILGRTQGFIDRRNQQEDEEEEEDEFVDMSDEEYQNDENTQDNDDSS